MSLNFNSGTLLIDVAVMSQEHSPIETASSLNHITELDEIIIPFDCFKHIFYYHGEVFGINHITHHLPNIHMYSTFLPPYRTVNFGEPFSLLEKIIANIETDLNVTRNCFLTSSLIELSKEITNIKSLGDIKHSDIVCSLTWSNLVSIIRTEKNTRKMDNPLNEVLLVISIVFKTPANYNILPTIIKFKYRIQDITNFLKK